jgi:hypothetical protein
MTFPAYKTEPVSEPVTLRQRYAMAALTGLLACPGGAQGATRPDHYAAAAFRYADAMLAAEQKS